MNSADCKPFCTQSLLLIAAGWFLAALFVGETELLAALPGPVTPIFLLTITGGLLAAYWKSPALRARVDSLDFRVLLVPHLARFVGIYFLVLEAQGELPGRFAIPAGWGDILAALGAGVVVLFPPGSGRNRAVLAWNAAGLADILFVVATAGSMVAVNAHSLGPLMRLPLSFLPTMLVPLIIASHVVIFVRLLRKTETPSGSEPQQQLLSL